MMKMKKLSAALVAVVMMIAMMSCIVVNVSAESTLSGPVAIEQVELGLDVSGVSLPTDCFVVSSNWAGLADGTQVNVKLDDTTYKAYIGRNAFAELGSATDAAANNMTIYVTAGTYSGTVALRATGLKIYGPYAGICPNAVSDATEAIDLAEPNPARPAADKSGDSATEAVLNNSFVIYKPNAYLTLDGLYFNGNWNIAYSGDAAESGQTRYGTYIRNCIADSTAATLFNLGRGYNLDFLMENNRILNAKAIANVAGFGDITLRSNYFNNTGKAVWTHSLASAAMGLPVIIENNYWENSGTIFSFDPSDLNYPSAYTVSMTGNYVNNFTEGYIVENEYLAMKSVPGLNINVVGNTFKGIKGTPFYFPYVASAANSTMARFLVNINENYFELSKSVTFIDSHMNAYLNCARNYYTSPMSADRVVKYKDSTFVYCPYYADPEMTTLVGGASIDSINLDADRFGVELDQEKKEVTIDFRGSGLDSFDLTGAIVAGEGCTWKMYKTATLEDEVENGIVYFDGAETVRYVAVSAADGSATTVYRFYLINDIGTESALLDVLFDNAAVPAPEVSGTHYTYNLDSEIALLNYELLVSSGATYTLWEDSQCQTTPLGDELGSYIPYTTTEEGYKIYVKVVSEDKNSTTKYTLEFVRPRSENYDPGVLAVTSPEGNSAVRNARKMIYYYCGGDILTRETFELSVTPGADYTIYADSALTKELSSGSEAKALTLKEGQNTFYVLVEDELGENVYTLVVENGVRSSDNTITGVTGTNTFTINGGKIKATSGISDSISVNFVTADPYATVMVYADPGRTLPLSYTSTPVTEGNRTVDDRSFSLETVLSTNVYYVVCKAENGATRSYMFQVEKTVYPNTFTDVKEGAWYAEFVDAVNTKGLMSGSQTGVDAEGNELYAFRPNDNVTRQEVATMICRLVGYNPTAYSNVALPFSDYSKIGSWARGYVKVCYHNGFMLGKSATTFDPKSYLTRQELMSIIARIFDLNGTADLSSYTDAGKIASWARADVEACVAAGIITGSNNKLNPTGNITRAEIATVAAQLDEKVGLYK